MCDMYIININNRDQYKVFDSNELKLMLVHLFRLAFEIYNEQELTREKIKKREKFLRLLQDLNLHGNFPKDF